MESFHAPPQAKVPPKSDLSSEQPKPVSASAGSFKDVVEDGLALDLTDMDPDTLFTDIDPNRLKYKDYDDTSIAVDRDIGDYNYQDANPVEWIRAKATKYLGQDKQRQTYNNELQDLLLDMIKGINNNHEQSRAVDQAHVERLQANCKKICMKHQTDLHILHQCLLEAHRHDLSSGSCKLLEERYKAYEEQLRLYHARLQLVLDKGAGLWALPEILQKIYKQHEKILDELHGRLLSTYEGKAGWNFFDMLERASQEKDLRVLHSSLLNLHQQVAKRDMLLHDSSYMQTSSVVDGIKAERPTLASDPGPIQEYLPSQASGLDSEFAINERRPSIDVPEPNLRQDPPSLSFSLLPDLGSLSPIKLDIEEMNSGMTGIRHTLPPITSNGGSLGSRWVSQDSNHKLNIRSGVNSHHASPDSEQLAGIGKVFDKLITPLCPVSSDGDVSMAEAPDEDSKSNTTEAQSTSSHESVEPYEQDTPEKPPAFGAAHVPEPTPGETTESGGPVQLMILGDNFVHSSRWRRATFLQRGPSSIDEMSPLSKFFWGIYTGYSDHDAFRGIITQSIRSRLSRAVECISKFSSWTSVTCRTNLPFLEPPLGNGKRCGRQLYDDFKEARPGAAEDLAKLLDHPQAAKRRDDFIITATRLVEMLDYLGICPAGMVSKKSARLELALTFYTLAFYALASHVLASNVLTLHVLASPALTFFALASFALAFYALTFLALAFYVMAHYALASLALASFVPAFLLSASLVPASLVPVYLVLASLALIFLALIFFALASERSPSSAKLLGKSSAPLATNTIAAASEHQHARGSPPMLQPGPDQEKLDLQKDDPNVSTQASNHESLFLLTCITISRFATSLLQLDLKQPLPILSDRQLLELLRTHYHRLRRNWRRRLLSFQTLTSIEFVQFELHRKSIVDIRKRDDIPPEDRRDEYQYRPIPAKVIPPVGRNYLMHIYHHPEDADSETVCLSRFPKRVRDRLELAGTDVPVGWGIEFVEGVHWNKVWFFGFAIVLVSLIMGVVWSSLKRDVQGGFGIAGFMMAFLTFMVGVVQAANA
ncbi:hypothetical protein EPUS_05346 [Endocarpon pusillum Z07020]|uniref:Uncharacterized protein n=1 Tax=Endocarpon pusillum (strain Z07020 / HMAS-L-300199) TaxID=1263415 RepID=U1GNP6_ENDPU|nr:uncharacterized protein EPUS_05346 [Endocarpon pusillum Z07020]ERF73923.1 hypothetical protein EPUS_05346 [Endocarpon pusillum Z07020]